MNNPYAPQNMSGGGIPGASAPMGIGPTVGEAFGMSNATLANPGDPSGLGMVANAGLASGFPGAGFPTGIPGAPALNPFGLTAMAGKSIAGTNIDPATGMSIRGITNAINTDPEMAQALMGQIDMNAPAQSPLAPYTGNPFGHNMAPDLNAQPMPSQPSQARGMGLGDPNAPGPAPDANQGFPGETMGEVSSGAPGGAGGGAGGPGGAGTVICTALYDRGLLNDRALHVNRVFQLRMSHAEHRGYLVWAKPLIRWATRNPRRFGLVYRVTRPLISSYMAEIQHRVSGTPGTFWGAVILSSGLLVSRCLGVISGWLRESRTRTAGSVPWDTR